MKLTHQTNEEVSLKDLMISQIYTVQALINVLEKKGVLTRDEILQEFHEIQNSMNHCDCGCDHEHNH